MGKSFEQQLGQYFKEDNVEVKNDNVEDVLARKEAARLEKRKNNKFNSKFKKIRKKKNKVTKLSRKKNRK
tara:strand:- start:5036 stop:5245 length:210 start_codon:yes stop_codon:yes gene_type:complete